MEFRIVHQSSGRIRLRSGLGAFNYDQAYGLEKRLNELPNVIKATANIRNGGLLILHTGDAQQIINFVRGIDIASIEDKEPNERKEIRKLTKYFVGKVVRKTCWHLLAKWCLPLPLRIVRTVWNYIPYFTSGCSSLVQAKLNVPVLDAVSIGLSIGTRSYQTAGSIMYLLSVTELLEEYTKRKTKVALASSLDLNIDRVWKVDGKRLVQVAIDEIKQGDVVRIEAGNLVPVDGTVLRGEAEVNQAGMTGESEAVPKREGLTVYAGTTVETGSIDVRVEAVGNDSRIAGILAMIDKSEALKAQIQSKAESLADSMVPFSLLAAGMIYLLTRNVTKTLSVLMVDYSCALKLATPITVISAMKEASERRIMVKGGKFLELFAKADTMIFDKTGTLTSACPKVSQVIPLKEGVEPDFILRTAACLEEHFPHSMARAVVRKAQEEELNHEEEHAEVDYIVAHGIASMLHGQKVLVGSYHFLFEDEGIPMTDKLNTLIRGNAAGKSNIFLAIGGEAIGMIGIDDPPRPEAEQALAELKELGIKHLVMLTGDGEASAHAVSQKLGIDEYHSQVLPEDKASYVKNIKEQGHIVCMVGDGINDSPALSCSDVSVAMKDSSDIAREVADIALLSDSLTSLAELRRLSTATINRIEKNYRFIVGFNSSLILLGAFGLITPALSALLHNASTLYVSAASTREFLPTDAE
jgi:heavy metal translocating P-type ATPase